MKPSMPRAKRVPDPARVSVPVNERQKPGPKPFEPTPDQRASVELMTAAGIAQDHIAGALGISDVTLRKFFAEEIAHGFARINELVVKKHIELIKAGDFQAIKFWEQARMGWSDKTTLVDDRPPQTRVIIELVGSPPPGPKTIDHASTRRSEAPLRNAIEFVGGREGWQ